MDSTPLHLLCVAPRFPGRLGAVADWLVRKRGYRCQFYCASADPRSFWPESVGKGLEVIVYPVGGVARAPAVPWQRSLERGLCYANGLYEMLQSMRPRPVDVVLGHSAGLGSTLFVPAALPRVPMVNLFDYYYHPHCHDLADEIGPEMAPEYFHWRQAANAMTLLDLENGTTPWTFSAWQRGLFPPEYQADFFVVHDGVDTRRFRPMPGAHRTVAGRQLPPQARVVSFVARELDQLRGFDRFLQVANRLLRARKDVFCLVVGAPVVQRALDIRYFNRDYRALLCAEQPLADPERFWFLGTVSPSVVAEVMHATNLHVYPSRSYPVSRSLVEALACGAVVLAADTEPVREFVVPGHTGLLTVAHDLDGWESLALPVLEQPAAYRHLGEEAARQIRTNLAQDAVLPRLANWLQQRIER